MKKLTRENKSLFLFNKWNFNFQGFVGYVGTKKNSAAKNLYKELTTRDRLYSLICKRFNAYCCRLLKKKVLSNFELKR